MTKSKYKILFCNDISKKFRDIMEELYNEGYELVAVDNGQHYFKRMEKQNG